MHDWQSLSHVRWECKYRLVIILKYRRKAIHGRLNLEGYQRHLRGLPHGRAPNGGYPT